RPERSRITRCPGEATRVSPLQRIPSPLRDHEAFSHTSRRLQAKGNAMDEPELAKIYDVVHQKRGEDYCAEAQHVADLVRTRVPDASSLIDVACGPGAHLRYFTALFAHTEGLE